MLLPGAFTPTYASWVTLADQKLVWQANRSTARGA
jgi:hypothetical protein